MLFLIHLREGTLQAGLRSALHILRIRRILVVLIDYLHDKGNECLDENLTTLRKVAPFLKQVNQFLAKIALTVMISKELEKLWCNLGRHRGYQLFVHFRKG